MSTLIIHKNRNFLFRSTRGTYHFALTKDLKFVEKYRKTKNKPELLKDLARSKPNTNISNFESVFGTICLCINKKYPKSDNLLIPSTSNKLVAFLKNKENCDSTWQNNILTEFICFISKLLCAKDNKNITSEIEPARYISIPKEFRCGFINNEKDFNDPKKLNCEIEQWQKQFEEILFENHKNRIKLIEKMLKRDRFGIMMAENKTLCNCNVICE